MARMSYGKWSRPFKTSSTADIIRGCFLFNSFRLKQVVSQGQQVISVLQRLLGKQATENVVRLTIFNQFAGGVDTVSTIRTIHQLGKRGVGGIPQYSVEQDLHSSEPDPYELEAKIEENLEKFIESIEIASSAITNVSRQPMSAFKITACCNPKLLVTATNQINSIPEWFDPKSWSGPSKPNLTFSTQDREEWETLIQRIQRIGQIAHDLNTVLLVDAEQTYFQPAIRHLVVHHLMPKFNTHTPIIYNTVQCYLKSAVKTMEQELQTAEVMGYKYGAKIVRGAYIDLERHLARTKGYEDPVHPTKMDTDNSYHSVMESAFKAVQKGRAHIKIATHNPNSVKKALKIMEELGIPSDTGDVTFGQLYGMGNHITFPLGEAGCHAYKIVPYGPVMEVVPYLLRRASENSSGMVNADQERKLLNKELLQRLCLKS